MFASQLLRILQTLPADANYETCGFDAAEMKLTMMENENGMLLSNGCGKGAELFANGTKDLHDSNGHGNDIDPSAFGTKDAKEFWKTPELECLAVPDDFAHENEISSSPGKEGQKRVCYDSDFFAVEKDPLTYDAMNRNSLWDSPEFACSMLVDLADGKESEKIHPGMPRISASDEFADSIEIERIHPGMPCGSASDDFADGKENERMPPGMPCVSASDDFADDKEKERILPGMPHPSDLELFETETHLFSDRNVMECELPELIVCYKESSYHVVKDICMDDRVPAVDKILIESWKDNGAGLSVSQSFDENKHNDEVKDDNEIEMPCPDLSKALSLNNSDSDDADEHVMKEKADIESNILDDLTSLKDGDKEDATDDSYLEDLMKIFGPKCTVTGQIASGGTEKESAVDSFLSLQESHQQHSFNPFLDSSSDDSEVLEEPSQILDETILDSNPGVSTTEESIKNGSASNLFYNSNVESSAITLIFSAPKPAEAVSPNQQVEIVPDQSLKTEDLPNPKGGVTNNPPAISQSASRVDENTGNIHEHVQESQTGDVHERAHETQALPHHEDGSSGNLSVASKGQLGQGEVSFSAAGNVSGLITYSGPITYSGSISLRSDSSTTSARSFAFPILQSEWTSSPVRMAKAERRHFRKHRGWRHGLLCCRF